MINWLLNAVILMLCAALLPGVEVSGFLSALLAVALIALVNTILGPILALLTLPATILSFGLFLIPLNGFLFYLAGSVFSGFQVNGAWSAMLGGLLYWVLSGLMKKARAPAVAA